MRGEVGQQYVLPGVAPAGPGRAGVVEQVVTRGAHVHGQPLTDIKHGDARVSLWRRGGRVEQQRQTGEQPYGAGGRAARQQRPEHAQCGEHGERQRCARRLPQRVRPVCQRAQPVHQPRGGQVRQRQQTIEGQQHAHEHQRRNQKTHHGDGDEVGDEREQRKAAKKMQQRGQGCQPDGHLQAQGFAPGGAALKTPDAAPQNHRHGAKGKPETRREHRPRLPEQDDERGGEQNAPGGEHAARKQKDGGNAQHQKRAQRRNAHAGEQRIQQGGEPGGECDRAPPRQAHRQPRRQQPPERVQHQRGKQRDERNVQPRDAH